MYLSYSTDTFSISLTRPSSLQKDMTLVWQTAVNHELKLSFTSSEVLHFTPYMYIYKNLEMVTLFFFAYIYKENKIECK